MMLKGKQAACTPRDRRRLDGRVKMALAVAYAVALFLAGGALSLAALAGLLAAVAALAHVPWRTVAAGGAPAYVIAAFLLLYNGVAAGWGAGALVAARIVLLVWGSIVLVETSTPTELSEALRRLLAPLARAGLPVRDATTALSIALRFMPLLREELASVRAAQISRGAPLEGGRLPARVRANAGLMVPLFVGLFRRADRLACAMDARCFGAAAEPTSLVCRSFSLSDGVVLVVGCGLCLGAALLL